MEIELKPVIQVWCDESNCDTFIKHLEAARGKWYVVSDAQAREHGSPAGRYAVSRVDGYSLPDRGLPPRVVEVTLERPSHEALRFAAFADFEKLVQLERDADREVSPWPNTTFVEPTEGGEARRRAEDDYYICQLIEESLLPEQPDGDFAFGLD